MKKIFRKIAAFSLAAVAMLGVSSCSDSFDEVTANIFGRQFSPTEFKASNATVNTVEMKWECITDNQQFQIELFEADTTMTRVKDLDAKPDTSFVAEKSPLTVENLKEKTLYSARIKTIAAQGKSESKYTIMEETFNTKKGADPEPVVTWLDASQEFTVGDLQLSYTFGCATMNILNDNAKFAIDANQQYFGDVNAPKKYTARLKSGGNSGSQNGVSLTMTSRGTMTIAMRSSSSSADRNVKITKDGEEVAAFVVGDGNCTKNVAIDGEVDPKTVFNTYTLDFTAGTYTFSYDGGLNFYGIDIHYVDGVEEPQEPAQPEEPQEQTLVLYEHDAAPTAGITLEGTSVMKNVKIHTDTEAVACMQLANSYAAENVLNGNDIKIAPEGGLKAGDVISLAGFFNNADDTKNSAVDIFVKNADGTYTVLFTTAKFINGKLSNDDPKVETFTLTDSYDAIYLGRNGNTGTNIYFLSITRK